MPKPRTTRSRAAVTLFAGLFDTDGADDRGRDDAPADADDTSE